MTPEQKKQLDRIILVSRLKVFVPMVATAAIVLGAVVWMTAAKISRTDATLERHPVAGQVAGVARLAGRRGGFQVHVKLDKGGEVDAVSALAQPPYNGEAVELDAATHASGRITYKVVRLGN